MDSSNLTNAIDSFKDFLKSHTNTKDSVVVSNIKEDMRHFLRLTKYLEDPKLKELAFEIDDALDELYQVIVIELNAVELTNFSKKDSSKLKKPFIENTANSNGKKDKSIVPIIPVKKTT